jgi:DNA-binding transcriptional MerR regulator
MRMRELEERTGVSRETVRFYIREGLLPEPERRGRTSARYDDGHVARLKAIRRLQDERHLPLAVIKALLSTGDAETSVAATVFPDLEADLTARLAQRNKAREQLTALQARLDVPMADLERLVATGIFRTETDANGTIWVSGSDIAIAERCAALNAAGFTEERGFAPEAFKFYLEFVSWLVGEELRLFLTNMAGRINTVEATQAAERGIDIINEILGLLRTRTVLDRLHAFRTASQDNDS